MVSPLLFFPPDGIPEVTWSNEDDLCDCTFQRVGWWTNPYLGRTLEIRFCCVWESFAEMFPEHFRSIPAYFDQNADKYVDEPAEWNGESDMPRAIWYRQIQKITNLPLDEIRTKFAGQEPPKGSAWKPQ